MAGLPNRTLIGGSIERKYRTLKHVSNLHYIRATGSITYRPRRKWLFWSNYFHFPYVFKLQHFFGTSYLVQWIKNKSHESIIKVNFIFKEPLKNQFLNTLFSVVNNIDMWFKNYFWCWIMYNSTFSTSWR